MKRLKRVIYYLKIGIYTHTIRANIMIGFTNIIVYATTQ